MSEKDRMRKFALMVHSGKLSSYNKNHPSYEEWLDDLDREISNRGTSSKWKALDKIDFKAIPDTSFTRDRTGAGSIEYFSADEPGIRYPNGYYVLHPMPGNDVILYNPNDNDELDIRLDALHIMPKDATYDALNSLYRDRARDSDVSYNALLRYAEDVLRYGYDNVDSYELYFDNEADGLLRNMFIEGTPEYIESKHYYPDKLLLREWNKDLLPYIDRILNYLETGERPKDILPEVTIIGKNKRFDEGGPKNTNREYKSANSWSTVNVGKALAPILEPISRTIMDSGETWALFSKDKKFTITNDDTSTAKSTYLMPRSAQRAVFLDKGYEPRPKDYGLVKKAVGNKNIPVYLRRPDDVSREDVVPIGNLEAWGSLDDQYDGWYGKHEAVLEVPAAYPTAFYISTDGKKIYQKGWDLNDYGDSANDWYDSNLKKNAAKALDLIGSPTVVTTGISEVGNFSDFYNQEPGLIEEMLQSKGLKPLQIGYDKNKAKDNPYYSGEYIPALPNVTIKGKRRNKKEDGGDITYVDTVRMDSNGNIADDKGNIIGDSVILPELEVTGVNPKNLFVQPNDNLWIDNGRVKNPELLYKGEYGAKSHAEWEKEHPVLNTWGNIAGAVPFAVAAAPLAPYLGMAGDALAATSVGNAITSGLGTMGSYITAPTLLGAPVYAWGDAALTSAFASHGINSAIEEGGVSPETLLEVAPLGQIVPKLNIDASKLVSKGYNKIKKQITAPKRLNRIFRENSDIMSAAHDAYINPITLSEQEYNILPWLRKPVSEIKERDTQIDKLTDLWSRQFTAARPKQHLSKLEKGILKTVSKQLTKSNAELIGDIENIIPYGKENVRKYLEKNLRDPSILDNLIITDDGVYYNSSSKAFDPLNAVTTGDIKMVDAATGKESVFKLEPNVFNTNGIRTYKYPNFRTPVRETQAQAIYPNLPKEYTDAVQKNIDFVTNEAVPGSKVFGSSANVSRGNLYHDASDIDVMMPESIAKKHKDFNRWSQESPDTYAYQHPTAGKIDVNILKNDKNGNAIGARAHEIYAQLYPKEYKALMDKYIGKGKRPSVDLPLDKSSEELFKNYDPVVKSIADAFGSSKDKHMRRAVYLLHYGKTDDVKKGFEMYANYLTAGEYKPSNLPIEAFSNPTKNSEIIDALGLNSINKEQFVNDPERMKLLFDYGYFHEGFLGRGIDVDKAKDIYPAFTTWLTEGRGGTANGVGLNTVLGGNSGFGGIYAAIIPEKLNIQFMTKDPIQLLEARRALLGRKPLTQDEIHTIDKLAQKHNINNIGNIDSFAEALSRTEGKNGQNYKDFLEDIEREFGIPAIQGKDDYGGSAYVSVTKDLPNSSVKQIIPYKLDRPVSSTLRDATSFQINDPFNNTFGIFSNVGASSKVRNSKLITRKLDLSGPEVNPLLQLIDRKKEALLEENALSKSAIKSKADEVAVRTHSRDDKLREVDNKVFNNIRKIKLAGKTLSIASGGALLHYLWSKLDKISKEERLRRIEERRKRKEQKAK